MTHLRLVWGQLMIKNMVDLNFIVTVFLIVVPAYMANGFALILGGGKPIDCGKKFFDGKRIFGEGKTFKGSFSGVLFGTLGIILEVGILNLLPIDFNFSPTYIFLGFFVSVGAVIGDILGSFIKRRLGLPRGAPAPILDQLDFILVGFLFAYIFNLQVKLLNLTLIVFLVVIIATPIAHFVGCFIAYKMGKKKEPW